MTLSIVIVNYNTPTELKACLISINRYIKIIDYEVLIVDNNSSNRGIEKFIAEFKEYKFLLLNENLGFSKANNFAITKASGDFILILNPDTELCEDCITPMLEFITQGLKIGACAPKLVYKDFRFQYSTGSNMGIFYEAAEAFMFINIYRKMQLIFNKNKYFGNRPFQIAWASGAFLLMKKDVFINAGGFNEDYFLNYEDIDLCRKIEKNGYANYYFPFLKCIHLDQTSQKTNYDNLVYSRYKSRLVYSNYHYSKYKIFIVRMMHLTGILLRLCFVNLLYNKTVRKQRLKGYVNSFRLYAFHR